MTQDHAVAAPDAPVIPTPRTEEERKDSRRAVLSSFLGSSVEYYDFLLYTAAAGLVFPPLFFSNVDPALGQLLAFATLLAGYLTRPLGGVLFGHFGDRFGRKNMLFITLMMMGVVSLCIGLMPTYATIGVAAPVLLVTLRVIQGIAVGGEWAGATLMAMEHSSARNKGFGASLSVAGGPTGAVLSTLVLTLFATLPDDQFYSWGWRVPFLLSVIVVAVGLYLRARVKESPEFEAARESGDVHTGVPIKLMVTKYPKEVLLGALGGAAPLFVQGLLAGFMVTYVSVINEWIPRSEALMLLTFSSFFHIFTIPAFAALSDRIGRKKVMIGGAIFSAVAVWPMFAMFNIGDPLWIGLAFMLGNPIIQASMYGPIGAFLSEKFATNARYTGTSLSFQLSSIIGAGVAPLVAVRLTSPEVGTTNLAVYVTVMFVLSGAAVALSRETNPLKKKGSRRV